jgi:hypothetical protein
LLHHLCGIPPPEWSTTSMMSERQSMPSMTNTNNEKYSQWNSPSLMTDRWSTPSMKNTINEKHHQWKTLSEIN